MAYPEWMKSDFQAALFAHLSSGTLRYLLEESLKSGYLSEQSLNGLQTLNWTKLPNSDTELSLDPATLDFKRNLEGLLNFVDAVTLISWISETVELKKKREKRH